jgi:radial spoke head protein 9
LFWGKLSGLNGDYYIALGLVFTGRYEFAEKRFYYATSSDITFRPFPALNDQHKEEYDKITTMLTGNAKLIHKKVEPEKSAGEAGGEEEQVAKKTLKEIDPLASSEEEDPNAMIVPVDLKEIDRVHFLVRAIENDCHIIPHGSIKLTTSHEVARNEAFKGLAPSEAFNLSYYSHFRNVQNPDKKDGLEKDDAIYQRNFLDDVSTDRPPVGCWSIQRDSATSTTAILRNLMWPGSYAYHKAGTRVFGSIYIGDGQKNTDLAFML